MRQRMTEEDSRNKVQPEPFTREEWHAMHVASAEQSHRLRGREMIDMLAGLDLISHTFAGQLLDTLDRHGRVR
jgi:hypothetical protein